MTNRAAALLLSLLAVRVQAAAPIEMLVLPAVPSAPQAISMAAPAAMGIPASFAAPALAPGSFALPALAVPAAAPARRTPPPSPAAAAPADVPTDAQLAALYDAARPGSPTIAELDESQGGFASAASGIVDEYTFVGKFMLRELRSQPEALLPENQRLIKAVEEVTSVSDSRDDPASRRFLQALGRRRAAEYHEEQMLAARVQESGSLGRRSGQAERRRMPRNDLGSGDYWDMAAGMNAGGFILRELEPGTRYSFFDLSPFVVSYLNALAARKGADAAAIEADVLKLRRPERPLAVLRTKNAVAYVPGFEKKLEEMADWIAPGGRLVIQNDERAPQRELIVQKHGELARRLIGDGWNFAFEFASSPAAAHGLDTLIFTRPKGAAAPPAAAAAGEAWARYVAAAKAVSERETY